jgi:hypothetical protein
MTNTNVSVPPLDIQKIKVNKIYDYKFKVRQRMQIHGLLDHSR